MDYLTCCNYNCADRQSQSLIQARSTIQRLYIGSMCSQDMSLSDEAHKMIWSHYLACWMSICKAINCVSLLAKGASPSLITHSIVQTVLNKLADGVPLRSGLRGRLFCNAGMFLACNHVLHTTLCSLVLRHVSGEGTWHFLHVPPPPFKDQPWLLYPLSYIVWDYQMLS